MAVRPAIVAFNHAQTVIRLSSLDNDTAELLLGRLSPDWIMISRSASEISRRLMAFRCYLVSFSRNEVMRNRKITYMSARLRISRWTVFFFFFLIVAWYSFRNEYWSVLIDFFHLFILFIFFVVVFSVFFIIKWYISIDRFSWMAEIMRKGEWDLQ